jgi:hypothetical protein
MACLWSFLKAPKDSLAILKIEYLHASRLIIVENFKTLDYLGIKEGGCVSLDSSILDARLGR